MNGYIARAGAATADLQQLRSPSPVVHSAAAIVLLLGAVVLSVYKPKGIARYGQRRVGSTAAVSSSRGLRIG